MKDSQWNWAKWYTQSNIWASSKSKHEVIHETISFFNKFGLNPDGKGKSLPIMYWTQKMHKEVIGTRFIVVSKNCSTKLISKVLSNAFKLIFHQRQSFYDKSYFYFSFKQFWAIQKFRANCWKKIKRLLVRLTQKPFRDLTFPYFLLN